MPAVAHLVARFVGSLWPGGPPRAAEAWVAYQLTAGEQALWHRLSGPDRRHAHGVARRVEATLGADATRPVLAAALLHDVGKLDSGLGTAGRVVATVAAAVVGRETVTGWADRRGPVRRLGRYLCHPELGGDRLARAGSDPLTVAWTRQHHTPADRWTIPRPLADALKAADDD